MRYPIRMKLRFTSQPGDGSPAVTRRGHCVDISRRGLLFRTAIPVTVGQVLEGSMAWPVRQAEDLAVTLFWKGRVVRIQGGRIAVRVRRYEFRTTSEPQSVAAAPPLAACG